VFWAARFYSGASFTASSHRIRNDYDVYLYSRVSGKGNSRKLRSSEGIKKEGQGFSHTLTLSRLQINRAWWPRPATKPRVTPLRYLKS